MKIKGFFINEKRYIKKWVFTMLIFFIIGIFSGTIYSTSLTSNLDNSVYSYLSSYFKQIRTDCEYMSIFKNSLIDYLKFFVILSINHLSDISFRNIFSHSIVCLCFMMGYFTVQKLLT